MIFGGKVVSGHGKFHVGRPEFSFWACKSIMLDQSGQPEFCFWAKFRLATLVQDLKFTMPRNYVSSKDHYEIAISYFFQAKTG